ncbi:histone-lysine N-methyltransferase SETMAR [Plakobranchus ocellatus]|uniref:Histone-lysine N-methyltransferase SETMAR n=1 Tax=Plakobranchus ocellatus TaxID=259542 RepID=A0AAV3Y9H1_9GAST|nr:histone-lysine N-methyltransferase SETMAR [Plakobranchus ocellatus]
MRDRSLSSALNQPDARLRTIFLTKKNFGLNNKKKNATATHVRSTSTGTLLCRDAGLLSASKSAVVDRWSDEAVAAGNNDNGDAFDGNVPTTTVIFTFVGTCLCVRHCDVVIRFHSGDCVSLHLLRLAWKIEADLRGSDNTSCLCHVMHDIEVHSFTTSQRNRRGDRCIFASFSPDLAPSDFHLFGPLKRHLGGMAFETEDDFINELRNWFDNLDVDFFRVGINSLLLRWQKCIDLHGDYVER